MKNREENNEFKRMLKILLIIIIGGVVFGYLCTLFFTKYMPLLTGTNTSFADLLNKNPFGDKEYVRILILGADNTNKKGYGLSDTIALFTINTKTKEIRVISFPRDTYVEELAAHKINSALKSGGPKKIIEIIESKFIYPNMIDYYILTSTSGLRNMVDLLGGVYIKIDKNMDYDDNWGNLHIHLKAMPEKQLLDGTEAEGFVRFRKDKYGDSAYNIENGEIVYKGRIARQQQFMMALCNRVISLPNKTERAQFLKKCYDEKYIESNLTLMDWNSLADFFKDIKPEQMMMDVLPGEPQMIKGVSYWVTNTNKLSEIVAKNVLFEGDNPKIPIEEKNIDMNQIEPPSKIPSETVISILNGSGVKGLAGKIGGKLRSNQYTNFTTGNADTFDYEQTRIKCKEKSIGLNIKGILGVGAVLIEPNQTEDVIIIIGKDYNKNEEN